MKRGLSHSYRNAKHQVRETKFVLCWPNSLYAIFLKEGNSTIYFLNFFSNNYPYRKQKELFLTTTSFISLLLTIFRRAEKSMLTILSSNKLFKKSFTFIEPTLIPSTTSSFAAAESPSSSLWSTAFWHKSHYQSCLSTQLLPASTSSS